MTRTWCALMVPGVLALAAVALVVVLLVVKLLWAWTIPDLFPGAVQQGQGHLEALVEAPQQAVRPQLGL